VNEERLNNFSDTKFLELREKKYLPAIYAHLLSLPQIERLASLKKPGAAAAGSEAAAEDAGSDASGAGKKRRKDMLQ